MPKVVTKSGIKDTDFCIAKEELKHMLNGFGRIIEFGTVYKDKNGDFNPTIHPN